MLHRLPSLSRHLVWMLLLTGLLTIAGPLAPMSTSAAPRSPTIRTVAEARSQSIGTVVTIDGVITVPAGAFRSGTFDAGFAVQDRTGGIYVSLGTDLGLQLQQQVRVTGHLAESFGLLILVPVDATAVEVRGKGFKVQPAQVATGAISEATEGLLVQVVGTITQPVGNDLPYGYRVFLDDGSGEVQIFVYASTGIDVTGLQPGQQVSVTGFSGQFADHYEINPRGTDDLRPTE